MADEVEPGKKILTLRSSDGEEFEVEEEVATESVAIKHMVQDDCADSVIPLPNVSSRILSKVIDYCRKHVQLRAAVAEEAAVAKEVALAAAEAAIEADVPTMSATKALKTFDAEFIDVNMPTLYDLIHAANYLEIKELLDLTCQKVSDIIKGKTPEQLRETFHLPNDFTPEEEAKVREANQWAFD